MPFRPAPATEPPPIRRRPPRTVRQFLVTLLAAVGLVLVLEGLPYFAAPRLAREVARWMADRPDSVLRVVGFVMMIGGLFLLYLVLRRLGVPS